MSSNRNSSRQASAKIAFCGLMTALSVTLMLTGGLIPIATYCAPMAAGILLLPVMIEFGRKAAWTTFGATAMICLMLGIDKEAAFFYLFLGYYPIVKWNLDRIKHKWGRLALKLIVFSASITLLYLVMGFLLNMHAILADFSDMGVYLTIAFLILFDVCMLLYDRLMFPLLILYANRIRPKLRFLIPK